MRTNWSVKPLAAVVKSTVLGGVGMFMLPQQADAAPQGGVVSAGDASISVTDKTTTIQQNSSSVVLDWQSFDVAKDELVQFNQPGRNAAALNRIHDQKASQILGRIEGNGRVFLVNPNGVVFGQNSSVDLGGLVVTTKSISNEDFMAGNYQFQDVDNEGLIVNRGTLSAATGGAVVLLGDTVANEGVIQAKEGSVVLASGKSATIDFEGDGLLQFKVSGEVATNETGADDAVLNSGHISVGNGQVLMTAKAARDVFSNVVNNTGVIEAQGIDTSGGKIRLLGDGGDVRNSGSLLATSETAKGGNIDLSGDRVAVGDNALVDVSGATGGGEIRIGGGYQGADDDIKNAAHTYVAETAKITADATESGDGGQVIVWADGSTNFKGNISATGKGTDGKGGFAEVSGKDYLAFKGSVDLTAESGVKGQLLLDPRNIEITTAASSGDVDDHDDFIENAAGTSQINNVDLETALSSADVTLQAHDDITVNAVVDASGAGDHSLTLEAGDDIFVNADITLHGSKTLTLTSGSDNSALYSFDGGIFIGSGGVHLTAGTVVMNADDSVTQAGVLQVNGELDINAAGGTVTLDTVGNDFDVVSVNATNATIRDNGDLILKDVLVSNDLTLDVSSTLTFSGDAYVMNNLTLQAGGDLTQSGGSLRVGDTADIDVGSYYITLDQAGNDFNKLDAGTFRLNVTDTDNIELVGVFDLQLLTVNAGGDITQGAGRIEVSGNTELTAIGSDITLNNASNDFNELVLNARDATVTDVNDVTLAETLLSGDLTLTAGGAIDQAVGTSLNIAGLAAFNAGSHNITLNRSGNQFNQLSAVAGDLLLDSSTGVEFAEVTDVNSLTVTAAGNITQAAGSVDVLNTADIDVGANSITLNKSGNQISDIDFTADSLDLATQGAVEFEARNNLTNLSVEATGTVTQANGSTLNVSGLTSIDAAGQTINFSLANTELNQLEVVADSFTLNDDSGVEFAGNSELNSLTVTTNGDITQAAGSTLDVANTADLTVGSNTITLDQTGNEISDIDFTASALNLATATAVEIESRTSLTGLIIRAGGAITQAVGSVLNVSGPTSLNSNSTISLNQPSTELNQLTVVATDFTLTDLSGVEFIGDSNVDSLTVTTGGDISQTVGSSIDVSGQTTLNASGQNINLAESGNQFNLITFDATDVVLGETDTMTLTGNSDVDNLTILNGGATQQAGSSLDVSGLLTVNAAAADIVFTQAANLLGTLALTANNAAVTSNSAISLNSSAISNDLTISSNGNITQTGAISVGNLASFDAGSADVTLDNAGNDFNSLSFTAANARADDSNAVDLSTSNLSGNLVVNAAGGMTDSGLGVNVAGVATFNAGSSDIVLDGPNNNFNSVALTAANAAVTDQNALEVDNSTIGGALSLIADSVLFDGIVNTSDLTVNTTGDITDGSNGQLNVAGLSFLNSGPGSMALDNNGHQFAQLRLLGNSATVADSVSGIEFAGSSSVNQLSVTANGDITQASGSGLTVSGQTTIDAGSHNIVLASNLNDFSDVTVTGAEISLADRDTLSLLGDIAATSLSLVTVNGLTFEAGRNLTVTDLLSIDAGFGNIDLTSANYSFSKLELKGQNATVDTNNAVVFSGTTSLNSLDLIAAGVTQEIGSSLSLTSASQISAAGEDIVLANAGNDFNALQLTADNATLVDSNTLTLSGAAITNDLNLTATGLNQSGAITSGGSTVIDVSGGNLMLNNSANDFSSLAVTANMATVQDSSGVSLGLSNIASHLTLTAGGDVNQTAAISVSGATSIDATGHTVALGQSGNDFSSVNVSADSISLADSNDLSVSTIVADDLTVAVQGQLNVAAITVAELDLTAQGNLTQSGVFEVTGETSISAANTILNWNNNFNRLSLNGGDLTINDIDGLELTSTPSSIDSLSITVGGDLVQSGAVVVSNGTTINAAGHDVLLDHADNDFNSLVVSADNLTVHDLNDLSLAGASVTDLTLDVGGALTQTGAFTVSNQADITATTATLTQANQFNKLAANGGSLTVTDVDGVELTGANMTGGLMLTAGGDITQSGALDIAGNSAFNAAGNTVTLDNAGNQFGVLGFTANDVVVSSTGMTLGSSNITNALTINASGAVTQNAAATGGADLVVNAAGQQVSLNQANSFASVAVTAADAVLTEASGIVLAAANLTGNLNLDAGTGGITQTAAVSVAGTADLTAQNDVVLTNAGNDLGTLSVTGSNVQVVDQNGLDIGTTDLTGGMTVTAAGDITQSGSLKLDGTLEINAAGQSVVLDSLGNEIATLDAEAAEVTVSTDTALVVQALSVPDRIALTADSFADGLDLTATDVSLNATGSNLVTGNLTADQLSLTASGDVSQATATALDVNGLLSVSANQITLDRAGNQFSQLSLSGDHAAVTHGQSIELQKVALNSLNLNVNGNISNAAAVVMNIINNLEATASGTIELGDRAGDTFNAGTLNLQAQDVVVEEDSATDINRLVANSATFKTTGNMADSGHLSVVGAMKIEAGGDIDLGTIGGSEATYFGSIDLKANNIHLIEEDAIHITGAEGDEVVLISESGGITTNGTTIVADSRLQLTAASDKDIGTQTELVDFTLNPAGELQLDAETAFITQAAADLASQVAVFSSSALIRSEANLAALSRSEAEFVNYLQGIDTALFDEFVTIFDIEGEGLQLPEDQQEEELAWKSDDGQFVVVVKRNARYQQLYNTWLKYGRLFASLPATNTRIGS